MLELSADSVGCDSSAVGVEDVGVDDSIGLCGADSDWPTERVGLASDAVREGGPALFEPVGDGRSTDPSPPQDVRRIVSTMAATAIPAVARVTPAVPRPPVRRCPRPDRGPSLTRSPSPPGTPASVSHGTHAQPSRSLCDRPAGR